MSRRILIVIGHPDLSPDRLCRSLAKAYGEGAEKAGHAVRRVDLAAIDFPMLRTMQEFEHGAVPDELKDAADAIVWAEHIRVLGGYALATGVLLIALALTAFRSRQPIAVAGALVGGAPAIGLMSVVNFMIDSDFKWPLFACALVWALSLIMYRFESYNPVLEQRQSQPGDKSKEPNP